jgi:hypothetical protein
VERWTDCERLNNNGVIRKKWRIALLNFLQEHFMKKNLMLVLVLIFVASMVPLFGQMYTNGTLTITDIPSEYNGKYAMFGVMRPLLYGFKSMDQKSPDFQKLVQISKGSVSIPVWGAKNYTGDVDAFGVGVSIFDSDTMKEGKTVVQIMFMSVPIKNGNATVAWKDGQIAKN